MFRLWHEPGTQYRFDKRPFPAGAASTRMSDIGAPRTVSGPGGSHPRPSFPRGPNPATLRGRPDTCSGNPSKPLCRGTAATVPTSQSTGDFSVARGQVIDPLFGAHGAGAPDHHPAPHPSHLPELHRPCGREARRCRPASCRATCAPIPPPLRRTVPPALPAAPPLRPVFRRSENACRCPERLRPGTPVCGLHGSRMPPDLAVEKRGRQDPKLRLTVVPRPGCPAPRGSSPRLPSPRIVLAIRPPSGIAGQFVVALLDGVRPVLQQVVSQPFALPAGAIERVRISLTRRRQVAGTAEPFRLARRQLRVQLGCGELRDKADLTSRIEGRCGAPVVGARHLPGEDGDIVRGVAGDEELGLVAVPGQGDVARGRCANAPNDRDRFDRACGPGRDRWCRHSRGGNCRRLAASKVMSPALRPSSFTVISLPSIVVDRAGASVDDAGLLVGRR